MSEGADVGAVPDRSEDAGQLRPRAMRWNVLRPGDAVAVSPATLAVSAIVLAVLLANLPYLLGFFDPNPLDFRSGLISAITPGPLPGKPWIDPAYGFTSQAIGHRAVLDLLHFRLPWWNPYEATGMPLVGESQAAALFPFTVLTVFSNGQLYEHMLLELIAGLCTYSLLRRIGLARTASAVGGIAYALNGKFAWFADATVNPLPFLPMLLLGIERAYAAAREGRPGGWRLIAVAGALSIYAGFPEVAYPNGLMAVCWAGWRFGCLQRQQLRPFVAKTALGAVGGALIAGPMLVATATYLGHADLGIHAGSRLGAAHLAPSAIPQLLMPYVYGQVNGDVHAATWLKVGGYLSTTLLVLAVIGTLAPGRRGLKLVLIGWALLVFARMYGEPPLLGRVIGLLPDMSRIQFYRYATAGLELPVIVLASLGVHDLIGGPIRRRWVLGGGVAALAAVLAAALYARPVVHSLGARLHHGAYFHASAVWAATIIVAVVAAAFAIPTRVRAALLVLVVAIDALALFIVPEFAAPRAATVDRAPVSYLLKHLGEARFFTFDPIKPNYGSYFGLASFGINDFPPKVYASYVRARTDPGVAFTGFRPRQAPSPEWELMHHLAGYRSAGVRYVLTQSRESLPESPSTLRLVYRSPTTNVYRLAGTSRYFSAAGCRVTSRERDSASVACQHPATLVRRETYFAGWSAQLDRSPTRIRRWDGLFQAISVPAGSHHVAFSFVPPGMNWALLGFLGGCVLMVAPTIRRLSRSLRPTGMSPGQGDGQGAPGYRPTSSE